MTISAFTWQRGEQRPRRGAARVDHDRPACDNAGIGDLVQGSPDNGGDLRERKRDHDHSRAVMGARWAHHDDVVRMAAAFRPALQARGVPKSAYLDNGSAFVDAWLLRGCAVLGIKLVHSRPGKPLLTGQPSGPREHDTPLTCGYLPRGGTGAIRSSP